MSAAIDRRGFLRGCLAAAAAAAAPIGPRVRAAGEAGPVEARYYEKLGGGLAQCRLCPRNCPIKDGKRGFCRARENRGGTLHSLVHSRPCAVHIDPIEKKPFFHVLPGTNAFSLATPGCNFVCLFCQNWQISQARIEDVEVQELPPAGLVERALAGGCRSIAFTYTEPTTAAEYVLDTAAAGRARGIGTVMVSNGYIEAGPARDLAAALAAYKVDLKSFRDDYYRKICSGALAPVKRTIEIVHRGGAWLEIVVLLVSGLNDSAEEMREMSAWIAGTVGPDVPVHFTRFHPAYRLADRPPTAVENVTRARDIARAAGIRFAYAGNVPGHEGESTYCPGCGRRLIHRISFLVRENRLRGGACPDCGVKIPGVWG